MGKRHLKIVFPEVSREYFCRAGGFVPGNIFTRTKKLFLSTLPSI